MDLLTPILPILKAYGLPYIVENVPGAPLRADVTLCGSMFACSCHGKPLGVRRHRWFQTNLPLRAPGPCRHKEQGRPIGVYHVMGDDIPKGGRTARTLTEASHAMGIGWMTWDELKEAIPPAYTRWLGSLAAEVLGGRE
jgi:DNA (cytosine-5)-methyltransferase 1